MRGSDQVISISLTFELIFVIDGSPDDSLDFLIERRGSNTKIVIVELARNFGHHHAIVAGLTYAKGEKIFLIDCDLEVRPAVLLDLHAKMQEGDYDVAYGYQEARKGGFLEKHGGGFFWSLFNHISATKVPENVLTERLMSKRYVESLLSMGDKNLFLGGMMYWVGYPQVGVPLVKTQREGASSYTFRKRLALLVEAISSFSSVPLRFLFYSGTAITAISFMATIVLIARKFLYADIVLIGFTFLATMMLLNLGLTILALGIIGIYLARIFTQSQNRPNFIVRNVYTAPR